MKDEFVALISHDLRTPLTSIMGYTELALDDDIEPKLDEERRSYLEVVSRSSSRLLRLVDDLLFVARLQSGRLDLTPAHPRPRASSRGRRCGEAQRRAEAKGVELVFDGNGAVEVDADKGRMFQLLDNLVSNAIKFTPEGGRIEITGQPQRRRGPRGVRHGHRLHGRRGGAGLRAVLPRRQRDRRAGAGHGPRALHRSGDHRGARRHDLRRAARRRRRGLQDRAARTPERR